MIWKARAEEKEEKSKEKKMVITVQRKKKKLERKRKKERKEPKKSEKWERKMKEWKYHVCESFEIEKRWATVIKKWYLLNTVDFVSWTLNPWPRYNLI